MSREENNIISVHIEKCPKCPNIHDLTVDLSKVLVASFAKTTLILTCPTTGEQFELHGEFE